MIIHTSFNQGHYWPEVDYLAHGVESSANGTDDKRGGKGTVGKRNKGSQAQCSEKNVNGGQSSKASKSARSGFRIVGQCPELQSPVTARYTIGIMTHRAGSPSSGGSILNQVVVPP